MNGANGKNKDESSFGKEEKSSAEREGADFNASKKPDGSDVTSSVGGNADNNKSSDTQKRPVFIEDEEDSWDQDSIESNQIFDKISDDRVLKMVAIYDDREEPFEKYEDKSFNIAECNRFEVDRSADSRFYENLGGAYFWCLHYRSNRELSRHQFGRIKNAISNPNPPVLFFPLIINKGNQIKDNLLFTAINGDTIDVASMKENICKSLRIPTETDKLQIYTEETARKLLEDFLKPKSK